MTGELWGWWRVSVDPEDEHFMLTVTVTHPTKEGSVETPQRRMPLNAWTYMLGYAWNKGAKDAAEMARTMIRQDLGLETTVEATNARLKTAKGTIRHPVMTETVR